MSKDSVSFDFDLDQRNGEFFFRYPAGSASTLWNGPYPDRAAAEAAAVNLIERFLSSSVAKALGFS